MFSLTLLVRALVYLVVGGLIVWVLWWVLQQAKIPQPFDKVARVVLILVAALIVIGSLLSLIGYPLIGP